MANETYEGNVVLPGGDDLRKVSLKLNAEDSTVKITFEEAVDGNTDWEGSEVKVADRLNYCEVVFSTLGIPLEPVELTWKFNASKMDDTLAGVIIPKPNDLRITGEKGFILSRAN